MATLRLCVLLLGMFLGFRAVQSSSLASLWEQGLPNTPLPDEFESLASPLSSSDVQLILSKQDTGEQSAVSKEFCSSAGIYCPQKDVVFPVTGFQPRVCIPPFFNYEYGVLPCRTGTGSGTTEASAMQASDIFLSQKALTVGNRLQLPDTSNDLGGLKFLPFSVASTLPELEVGSMQHLARFYGVHAGSDMELQMKNTLEHCGFKSSHEPRTCQVVGEGVILFASEVAGHNAAVVTAPAISKQEVMIMDIGILAKPGDRTISCHNMMFPSLLYSCHMTQSAQVMNVSVKLANGQLAQVPAVCHMDTSYWNPSHIAFEILNVQPGQSSICHWFPENTFVFVGKSNA